MSPALFLKEKKLIMKISGVVLVFILSGVAVGCRAAEKSCHLTDSTDQGFIYKVCGDLRSKVNLDYDTFIVSLSDDIPTKGLAILLETPKSSQMNDERYFILNYEDMIVYDNTCLGGNFIMINNKKQIVFEKYGSANDVVFEQETYSHCKQILKKWVDTQQKW